MPYYPILIQQKCDQDPAVQNIFLFLGRSQVHLLFANQDPLFYYPPVCSATVHLVPGNLPGRLINDNYAAIVCR